MTLTELAAQIMQRPDVYDAERKGPHGWQDYLGTRLKEAGLLTEAEYGDQAIAKARTLNAEIVKIWQPAAPHWSLDAVLKSTAADDRRAMAQAIILQEQARSSNGELRYSQDGHTWVVSELRAGARSGTPQARVLPSGRWFCFHDAAGFHVGERGRETSSDA